MGLFYGDVFGANVSATHHSPALSFHRSLLGSFRSSPYEVSEGGGKQHSDHDHLNPAVPNWGYRGADSRCRIASLQSRVFMASSVHPQTYVARTCLRWSADGSLSEHDRSEVMKRLCIADAALAQTHACHVQDSGPADWS